MTRTRALLLLALLSVVACGGGTTAPTPDAAPDVLADAGPDTAVDAGADGLLPPDVTPLVPLDEPIDVTMLVRLTASGTRPTAGILWPREAEEALWTVRDDFADTGWGVPMGEEAVAELDFVPAYGGPSTLHEALALRLEGATPDAFPERVEVDLLPACGAPATKTVTLTADATTVPLAGVSVGCIAVRIETAAPFRLVALSVTSRDPRPLTCPTAPEPDVAAASAPRSGVIEGFYGRPWSFRERHAILDTMRAFGLGAYLYAPKNDPLHRSAWRTPYPSDFLSEFERFTAAATARGVTVFFGLSPFIDFDDTDEADYAALLAKVRAFVEIGVTGVALLADDIELEAEVQVDAALGARHAAIVARLLADLRPEAPTLSLWFVPTAYSDDRARGWPGGWDYLGALAALDPAVEVLWTGRDTFTPDMEPSQMERVSAAIGRAPVIWDNHFANDGGDGFFGRILAGPVRGRAADLFDGVRGIAENLSIQGGISRLTLATFGAYVRDPAGYDPDTAFGPAAALEARRGLATVPCFPSAQEDPDLAAAIAAFRLEAVMHVFDGGNVQVPVFAEMESAVRALRGALTEPALLPVEAAARAAHVFAGMVALPGLVHGTAIDAELVDELEVPLAKVRLEGRAGLAALAFLGERLAGREGTAERAVADAAAQAASQNRFQFSNGVVPLLLADAAAGPPRALGFVAPVEGDAPPPCRLGEPWRWWAFAAPAEVWVFGLPEGATVNGEVQWTPTRGGRYPVVVVASTGAGWASREAEIVCW